MGFQKMVFMSLFTTQSRLLTTHKKKAIWKHCGEKRENAGNQIFSFSHMVFYPIKDRNHHMSCIYFVICKCFEFNDVQNSVVW